MSKIIKFDRFREMWLELSQTQRQELTTAYFERFSNRIRVDQEITDVMQELNHEPKLNAKQAFVVYVAAMYTNLDHWFFTTSEVYWSPRKKIITNSGQV